MIGAIAVMGRVRLILGYSQVAGGLLIPLCTAIGAAGRGPLLEAEAAVAVARPTARYVIAVLRDDRGGVCLESRAVIAATLARVLEVLTDFGHHSTLSAFPTRITVLSAQPDRFTVQYVESVRFWPDPTYTLHWTVQRSDRALLLWYRGSPDDSIAGLEGFSRLEPDDRGTLYRGIDCFTPPGPGFMRHRAVSTALAQTARDTLALFLRAEHAELSNDEIRRRALEAARAVGAR